MNRSWNKQIGFQNVNTAVMSTTEKKPWSNFEISKQFKPKYLHRKNMLSKLYIGFKIIFNIFLIRIETFVDHLCKINSYFIYG